MNVINELCEKSTEYVSKIVYEISDLLNISKFLKFKNSSESKSESDYVFKKFTLSKNIAFNPFLSTENFLNLPNLNYVRNKNILLNYANKFINARNTIIKLQINVNHYKIMSEDHLPIRDEDIKDLKDNFFSAQSFFEELFEVDYKYYYKKDINLELQMKRIENDLNLLFDFIEETFKSFSDDYYIYSNEELNKIYIGSYNNIYNKYLQNFYN